MQDANNDMADLFRKAAEEYPLRIGDGDWGKVLQGLQQQDIPMPVLADTSKKRKKRALWLLLLLPLIALYVISYNHSETKKQPVTKNQTEKDKLEKTSNTSDAKSPADVKQEEKASSDNTGKNKAVDEGKIKAPGTAENRRASIAVEGNSTHIVSKSNNGITQTSSKKSHSLNKENDIALANSYSKENNPADRKSVSKSDKGETNESNRNDDLVYNKNKLTEKQPGDASARIEDVTKVNDSTGIISNKISAAADSVEKVKREDSTGAGNIIGTNKKDKKLQGKMKQEKGFYGGLLASFDISTIKLQKVNRTGYSFDLLAGYRFSNRLSVESGVNWSNKKYYTTGKYFDKTRTGISPQSEVLYTNGSCSMFEIPVTIKYDFAQKAKSNLFVTAGLSSYIMKDEKYFYHAKHGTSYYDATKKYNNSGSNWLSVAGLSIGYQVYINRHITLRAEPYIKMPLTGIGIAKLPIASAGISAGFIRSF